MLRSLRKSVLPFSLLIASVMPVSAQIFTTPMASEFDYAPIGVGKPNTTANYSMKNVNTGFGMTDLYVSAWSTNNPGATSEFIYQFTNPSNPTSILSQGSFNYTDATDLGVGILWDSSIGDYVVLVSYYRYGAPGHFVDIYKMTGSPGAPLALSTTLTLSSSPTYGRIRMDSHKTYGIAITWDNPGVGIETIVCDFGNWSGITTLAGTNSEASPDVAFSHSSGPLNVHYVYRDAAAGTMTESVLDWSVLMSVPFGGTATMWPLIEDVNIVPFWVSDPVLDCPDHYDVENWAYTYTNGDRVFVRFMDYHSSGLGTAVVNDGSIGNAPLARKFKATAPTLHYGDGGNGGSTGQISVGWWTTSGNRSLYVGIEMKEGGGPGSLINFPDYMELPSSLLPYTYPHTGISYSKMSDGPAGLAPDYMYATYFTEKSPGSGVYVLHHAFHKWNNPVFRGAGNTPPQLHPECGQHNQKALATVTNLTVYPNPFQSSLTNSISLAEAGVVDMTLTDITGRIVAQQKATLAKGTHQVKMDGLTQLSSGTYFLSTALNGKKGATQIVAKH